MFDGSATSMSGDGSFVSHNGSVGGAGTIYLPSGNGGGCLQSGPFVKYVSPFVKDSMIPIDHVD